MSALRLAVVVPRYGAEVNGGAEALARAYAERLAGRCEVTVLTTCALDYRTWADHYPPGASVENGVRVLRFPVPEPRDPDAFDALSARVLGGRETGPDAERRWMRAQGPNAPALLEHLRAEGRAYDAVVFIPYLYATTADGLPLVADRAVLVPCLHDEPPARLAIFADLVRGARALVFNTPEERDFAARRFALGPDPGPVVGVGIDPPPPAARGEAGPPVPDRPYALCLGRIDPSKGSTDLLAAHRAYRRARPEGLDLAMVGRAVVSLPDEPWLHAPGFVTEAEKHRLLAGASVLVAPSPYESLSLVLLEAWSHGTPTLASERSDVLVGQTRRAGAGLWYADALEYLAALDLLTGAPAIARALGQAGRRFTARLRWPAVIDRLEACLREAAGLPPAAREPSPPDAGRPAGDGGAAPPPRPPRAGALQVLAPAPAARAAAAAVRLLDRPAVLHVAGSADLPAGGAVAFAPGPAEGLVARLAALDCLVAPPGDGLAEAAARAGTPRVDPDDDPVRLSDRLAAALQGDQGSPAASTEAQRERNSSQSA